ncbi:hypothetical protein [Anaeromyxobacter oryzisoli]|uniref:hypothetical protein n=1 Tax=Anaeromyxobacter oryzisoli TaxID=2925408 RepID=UPI001F56D9D0|nr:hypothetical protein [Anaeromyxobacter sp. SG63]
MIRRFLFTTLFIPAIALVAPPAAAFELADGRLNVGLTGGAAYARTDHNTFARGDKEGQYDNTSLAVAIIGHVSDQLSVVGRFDIESQEDGAEIDWAFAEWKVNDALRLRAGMGKHAFGNYGEILEEGTLRPFFDVPHSMYGPANIAGEGYTGLGLTGFFRLGERWGLSYDLYGGELDVETSNALARIAAPALNPAERFVIETRDMIGARLGLEMPGGLVARLSGYTGVEEEYGTVAEGVRHTAAAGSTEYLGESLTFRAEYAYMIEQNTETTRAAYVEAAWLFGSGLQLAGRVEGSWSKIDGFTGSSPNLRHREAAVGLNYWFSPEFVLKASYHLVDGNRFAFAPFPEDGTVPSPIPEARETTQLYLVGAQFSL